MVFSFALSIDPDYVPGMVCMAEILRNIGGISLSSARTFLRNALRLEPTNHQAWLSLGLVLKAEGSLLEAADCFQAAYELRELSPIQDFSKQLPIMLHQEPVAQVHSFRVEMPSVINLSLAKVYDFVDVN